MTLIWEDDGPPKQSSSTKHYLMRFPEYVIHVEQNWQVPVEGLLNIQAPAKLARSVN